jgi:hypothetical protein
LDTARSVSFTCSVVENSLATSGSRTNNYIGASCVLGSVLATNASAEIILRAHPVLVYDRFLSSLFLHIFSVQLGWLVARL